MGKSISLSLPTRDVNQTPLPPLTPRHRSLPLIPLSLLFTPWPRTPVCQHRGQPSLPANHSWSSEASLTILPVQNLPRWRSGCKLNAPTTQAVRPAVVSSVTSPVSPARSIKVPAVGVLPQPHPSPPCGRPRAQRAPWRTRAQNSRHEAGGPG